MDAQPLVYSRDLIGRKFRITNYLEGTFVLLDKDDPEIRARWDKQFKNMEGDHIDNFPIVYEKPDGQLDGFMAHIVPEMEWVPAAPCANCEQSAQDEDYLCADCRLTITGESGMLRAKGVPVGYTFNCQ